MDLVTIFTAVATCINNVGPGLEIVGPMGNFSAFSPFSKLLLSFDMLVGRLEIFPMLLLFAPPLSGSGVWPPTARRETCERCPSQQKGTPVRSLTGGPFIPSGAK